MEPVLSGQPVWSGNPAIPRAHRDDGTYVPPRIELSLIQGLKRPFLTFLALQRHNDLSFSLAISVTGLRISPRPAPQLALQNNHEN